ncbi:7,8-dihydropterin-6-yl-methyl-4-(beta-D-ribofuranosyl)aminobenzene 5'-phosphate synthase [Malonomonas rubra DSM 5091]|uniref:7,8-dihydropterin-6-yl-methyl-4-(Beta-D-ribofuranosyl)aminobenzene 5'-phosphate synthase n=1 Tax=Malonomonas rubra DSM 5091 TaxID=1122189 RepID=A0A1M6MXI2_MALRU|nr:MBL fold metallo-hydrolase [Malonomonas rubra]SHJ88169.1 7,8-dihydropterin-6-yl-methyl-4-(beta-D-ribofuranosyl)aminobenzene 5'-phosphate synthase [Malonomonas rubra DSM 5091]
MSLKLIVLCENSVERVSPLGLLGEHGFACHLQTDHGNFLFDTGGGQTIINNSDKLKIDLSDLQGIIFSHGHLDHTGGLPQVLERCGKVPVYAHTDLFVKRHSSNGNQLREIGLPWSQSELEAQGAEFKLSLRPVQIAPGLTLSGEIPRVSKFETGDPNLIIIGENGDCCCDPLADDYSLFIHSPKGLIILLGCAHAGVLNIIEHACHVTKQPKVHMLIGGTHLKFSSPEQLAATLDRLEEVDIDRIGVSHCTGLKAAQKISERFGDKFFYASVGCEIEF